MGEEVVYSEWMRTIATEHLDYFIKLAQEHPPKPLVEGLWDEGSILLLHGDEGVFKSFFLLQMMKALATGKPFLRKFRVPQVRRVGVLETELNGPQLGVRLQSLFPAGEELPENFVVFNETNELLDLPNMIQKMNLVTEWIKQNDLDAYVVDLAMGLFGTGEDPVKHETKVGAMFGGLRKLQTSWKPELGGALVRHDRKEGQLQIAAGYEGNSNDRISGTVKWKADPEHIIWLRRPDRRVPKIEMVIGKNRAHVDTDPLPLWFDQTTLELSPLPPVIAALEHGPRTREEILAYVHAHYGRGIGPRTTEKALKVFEEKGFLIAHQVGKQKSYELSPTIGQELVDIEDEGWVEVIAQATRDRRGVDSEPPDMVVLGESPT